MYDLEEELAPLFPPSILHIAYIYKRTPNIWVLPDLALMTCCSSPPSSS